MSPRLSKLQERDASLGVADAPGQGDGARLLLLGFLTLFVELALIRYLPAVIWNLGYFPNFVLIAVFVGMGTGFATHQYVDEKRSLQLFLVVPLCLLGLLLFAHYARPGIPGFSEWSADVGGELFFTLTPKDAAKPSWLPFVFTLLSIVLLYVLISQRTAKLFRRFAPLWAYTLDIGGSCCGILAFMALSWLTLPAAVWFALTLPLFWFAMESGPGKRGLALLPIVACAGLAHSQDLRLVFDPERALPVDVTWSPYQKIERIEMGGRPWIMANGIPHQTMFSIQELERMHYPEVYRLRESERERPPFRKVLVIGAGSGNDVAVALRHGATHVDAVEIDPVIQALGRAHHPSAPYADPRTHAYVNDGRAFMRNTPHRYDLIVFALTDSLVKVSAMTQLRLENYIYTVESIRKAFDLLSEDGVLLFYNHYRREWLVHKIERMIFEATGRRARSIYQEYDFQTLIAEKRETQATPRISGDDFTDVDSAVDDWPFFYMRQRGLGGIYLQVMLGMGLVLVLVMGLLHRASRKHREPNDASDLALKVAFMLMGVAFLLLETKSVIQFSLLFGTTWLNASLVFFAVLVLVLAANWIAVSLPSVRLLPVFALLVASTLVPLLVPLGTLLDVESGLLRFTLASVLTFLPIFFANLLFSLAFRDQPRAEHLFGWNLLGATLGGVLEYSSMLLGYTALALVVAGCYAGAFALLYVHRTRTQSA